MGKDEIYKLKTTPETIPYNNLGWKGHLVQAPFHNRVNIKATLGCSGLVNKHSNYRHSLLEQQSKNWVAQYLVLTRRKKDEWNLAISVT